MGSRNMLESEGLEREKKRLEINVNVSRLKEFLLNELNTKRLRTRAIPVSPPVVHPRSRSVPLDRLGKLAKDEESDLEVVNSIRIELMQRSISVQS